MPFVTNIIATAVSTISSLIAMVAVKSIVMSATVPIAVVVKGTCVVDVQYQGVCLRAIDAVHHIVKGACVMLRWPRG